MFCYSWAVLEASDVGLEKWRNEKAIDEKKKKRKRFWENWWLQWDAREEKRRETERRMSECMCGGEDAAPSFNL